MSDLSKLEDKSFKKLKFIFIFLFGIILLISLVKAGGVTLVAPQTSTTNLILINESITNVNNSNYWNGKADEGDLDHNSLGGLEGGTAGEYYHLTSADYAKRTLWYNHTADVYTLYNTVWASIFNSSYATWASINANLSDWLSTYNTSYALETELSGNNSAWLSTHNTSYATWTSINANLSDWLSTYNSTYDAKISYNSTFNQTLTDGLYLGIGADIDTPFTNNSKYINPKSNYPQILNITQLRINDRNNISFGNDDDFQFYFDGATMIGRGKANSVTTVFNGSLAGRSTSSTYGVYGQAYDTNDYAFYANDPNNVTGYTALYADMPGNSASGINYWLWYVNGLNYDTGLYYGQSGTLVSDYKMKDSYGSEEFYFQFRRNGTAETNSKVSLGSATLFSGTSSATYTGLYLNPTIWQYSSTGNTYGVRINPTIKQATSFRGVQIENNQNWSIYQSGASALNYFNGDVGIGTAYPSHPLEIVGNATDGISLWVDGNVSASGYNTRTEVYNKNLGLAIDRVKDASQLRTDKGEINHSAYGECYAGKSVPIKQIIGYQNVTIQNKTCTYEWVNKPTDEEEARLMKDEDKKLKESCEDNPYIEEQPIYKEVQYEQVNLVCLTAKHEQALYELKQQKDSELALLDARIKALEDRIK